MGNKLFFPFLKFFIYLWETERGEGQKERETQNPKQLQGTEHDVGLKLTNSEIVTWAEIKSQTLNQLSFPGAPVSVFFKVNA